MTFGRTREKRLKRDGKRGKRSEKQKKKDKKSGAVSKSEISVNYERRVYAIGHTPRNVISVESIRRKEEKKVHMCTYMRYMCKYTQSMCIRASRALHGPMMCP